MPTLRQITANAEVDALTADDYRTIYEEVRSKMSLRQFVEQVGGAYSIAWWSKYERDQIHLTRGAKNELRRLVGLDMLPPSLSEVVATIDPDATVYQIGDDTPNRVVLVGCPDPITIRLNGTIEVIDEEGVPCNPVTAVTPGRRRAAISLRPELFERLNTARRKSGKSWHALLSDLVAALDTPEERANIDGI